MGVLPSISWQGLYSGDNFYRLDTILIPICSRNVHWSLCAIRPCTRTITFWDSKTAKSKKQQSKAFEPLKKIAMDFINIVTWEAYDDNWRFSAQHGPQQEDSSSCGLFVCTHMMSLALGLKPVYRPDQMPKQRQFIAAVLKGKGFRGSEFQWEELYTNIQLPSA